MECEEVRPLLEAYVDNELADAERSALTEHIAGCEHCGPEATALERLRDSIRRSVPVYRAPETLRSHIRFALRRQSMPRRPAGWLAYAASLLLAVALGAGGSFMIAGGREQDAIASEVIDSHLRSLLGTHLTDVASSDQHTVKPWFVGRTDVAPPAVDLAAEGFPLVGGRLELIAGHPVPALVYRRRQHVINLFVLPLRPEDRGEALARHGYNLRRWTQGDLGLWAVSDAAQTELVNFEHAFRAATGG